MRGLAKKLGAGAAARAGLAILATAGWIAGAQIAGAQTPDPRLSFDAAGFPARRAASEQSGKRRGLGIGCYIEAAGIGPSARLGKLGAVNDGHSCAFFAGSD